METWLNELAKRNIFDKVYILIGITPMKSLKMAKILSNIPGVYLPKVVMERMEAADNAGNAREEGFQIALELIHKIKMYHGQGVNGIHLMPVGWDEIIPRIIMEADLLPRSAAIQALNQSI
jgi:methylenetetrahydrofolate reductase (NADPH)